MDFKPRLVQILVLLLAVSVSTSVHIRHIRSVNDDVSIEPEVPPEDATAPPPPPDGGAKTLIEPEDKSEDTGSAQGAPQISLYVGDAEGTQPENGVPKNDTLPVSEQHGKAGFGGEAPEEGQEVAAGAGSASGTIVSNKTLPVPKPDPEGKAGFGGPEPPVDVPGAVTEAGPGDSGKENTGRDPNNTRDKGGKPLSSCRVCAPGSGVLRPCTATEDTVCSPCGTGFYSEGYSATTTCLPCTTCSSGYYQRTPCVADSDTICGACHSHGNGYGNEDFLKSCEGATAPPTTVSTVEVTHKAKLETTTVEEQETKESPTPDAGSGVEQPYIGEAKDKDTDQGTPVERGAFQWPILLACIASAVVFFIIGIVTSMLCKRSREKKRGRLPEDSPSRASSGFHDSDAASPLNPVQVVYRDQPDHEASPAVRHSTFYNSHELFYIDEDSDDEVANQLGRPSTAHHCDSERKPRSLMSRLRDSPLVARITGSPRRTHAQKEGRSLRRQSSIGSISNNSCQQVSLVFAS